MRDNPPGYWVGHPGALLPLPGVKGSLSRKTSRGVTYATSASGNLRAYLSARRAPLRTWTVSIPLVHADQIAALHSLVMDTDPPFVWVDPASKASNLLTPAAAAMRMVLPELQPLGRQPLEDGGYAATAAANPGGSAVYIEPAPVIPGQPVTVSAFVASLGGAQVRAAFLDSNGQPLSESQQSAPAAGLDLLRRVAVTAVPPGAAAAVSVVVTGASVIANPAVTWSSDLLEYGPGGGCPRAMISELDEDFDQTSSNVDGLRIQSVGFTVTELG